MKKFLLATASVALMSTLSINAEAAKLEQSDQNVETRICYTAATKGMKAVEKMVNRSGLSFSRISSSLTCNGMGLEEFANKYKKEEAPAKEVLLVAENQNLESRVCIEALMNGIDSAVSKFRVNADYITCNGLKLPRFVEKNKGNAVAFKQ